MTIVEYNLMVAGVVRQLETLKSKAIDECLDRRLQTPYLVSQWVVLRRLLSYHLLSVRVMRSYTASLVDYVDMYVSRPAVLNLDAEERVPPFSLSLCTDRSLIGLLEDVPSLLRPLRLDPGRVQVRILAHGAYRREILALPENYTSLDLFAKLTPLSPAYFVVWREATKTFYRCITIYEANNSQRLLFTERSAADLFIFCRPNMTLEEDMPSMVTQSVNVCVAYFSARVQFAQLREEEGKAFDGMLQKPATVLRKEETTRYTFPLLKWDDETRGPTFELYTLILASDLSSGQFVHYKTMEKATEPLLEGWSPLKKRNREAFVAYAKATVEKVTSWPDAIKRCVAAARLADNIERQLTMANVTSLIQRQTNKGFPVDKDGLYRLLGDANRERLALEEGSSTCLNDEVINLAMANLTLRHPFAYIVQTLAVATLINDSEERVRRLLQKFDRRKHQCIVVPYNKDLNHWSTLVLFLNGDLLYYDPLGGKKLPLGMVKLVGRLLRLLNLPPTPPQALYVTVPRQVDTTNCGIYLIFFVMQLLQHLSIVPEAHAFIASDLSTTQMDYLRRALFYRLSTGDFAPEPPLRYTQRPPIDATNSTDQRQVLIDRHEASLTYVEAVNTK